MESPLLRESADPVGAGSSPHDAAISKWEDNPFKKLIEMGACMFVWIIGLYCCFKLMHDYHFILEPLFLAVVFVSVLEGFVKVCQDILGKLCCCGDKSNWHCCLRFVAIILTLVFTGIFIWVVVIMISFDLSEFIRRDKPNDYKEAAKSLAQSLSGTIRDLPTYIHMESVNNTHVIDWWHEAVHNHTSIEPVVGYLKDTVKPFFTDTSNFLMQTMFFLLYSMFMLFEPVHLETIISHSTGETKLSRSLQKKDRVEVVTPFQDLEKGRKGVVKNIKNIRPSGSFEHAVEFEATVEFEAKQNCVAQYFGCYYGPQEKELKEVKCDPSCLKVTRRPTVAETVNIIQKYFKLKTIISFATCLAYGVLFYKLNTDLPLILMLVAFFSGFIPEFGFLAQLVVSIPVVMLSPVQKGGALESHEALKCLGWFIMGSFVIKFAINNVIETIVMKSDTVLNQGGHEVHPVVILFLLALGGELWGCVGMLLAVPAISLGRLLYSIADEVVQSDRQ